jgi:hypothetical protein
MTSAPDRMFSLLRYQHDRNTRMRISDAWIIVPTVAGAKREVQRLQKIGILARDTGLQLGFGAFPIYNIAPHTLSIIGVLPANDGALNSHLWRNDARSHYQ